MHLAKLQVLSESEIQQIHEATLSILQTCGIKILNPRIRSFLEGCGLATHAGEEIVFFSRTCEQLPNIDAIGIPVMPQDVPHPADSLLYGVKACIENSRKPIFFSTDNPAVNRKIMDLLAAVFPGNLAHDEQNAWEKTLSLMCALGTGNDLIVNCGMFATGMTCSHEQLLMDEEIAGMCRRLAEGIEVTEASIALDLIREIGPRGTGYLTAGHTLERLRSREYWVPRLAVRGPRAAWEAEGGKDTYALARQEARKLGARPAATLDRKRQEQLDAAMAL